MNRTAGIWFLVAGAVGLGLWTFFTVVVGEAEYYDADTFGDYATVLGVTTILVVAGVALIVLWRDPPVRRGSLFLLLAGIGFIAEGVGNLLEDIFGIEAAVWLFFGGGFLAMLSLLIAGTAALTVSSPQRWSGIFLLLGIPAAMLGFGWVIAGVAFVLFGGWLISGNRAFVIAVAIAAVPLAVAGVLVNT